MTRLYIEGYEVDITSELSNQITFAIDDIRKIDSKSTTYSKTIILPGSALNNRIFGNIYELSRSNDQSGTGENAFFTFDPSRSASARLEINGVLIMKGIARLMMVRKIREAIEYEIALFGELGGFISSVGNKKLEDLDFSQYNHKWNATNITDSWTQSNNSITASIDITGPFYSSNYNPPIDLIKFIFTGQIPWLSINDEFTVAGTTYNDGIYTAFDVIYDAGIDTTFIIVQYFPPAAFTAETVSAKISKIKVYGSGYVCPLIDYGQVQPSGFPLDHDFRHFRPALFVREYMEKIIHGAGFTYESLFFDTPFFRRLIIPNNEAFLQKIGSSEYVNAISNDTNETFVHPVKPQNYGAFQNYISTYRSIRALNWNIVNALNTFVTDSVGTVPAGKFKYIGGGAITIKISINIDIYLSISAYGNVLFQLIKKSGSTEYVLAEQIFRKWSGLASFEFSENTTIIASDEIYVRYIAHRNAVPYGTIADLVVDSNGANSTIQIVQDPPGWVQYNYDEVLEINKLIPKNIFQRDFFLSIVKMFNLMITEDPLRDNHLIITPYIDFYNQDPSTYIDWSYKIARDKIWQIKPMSEANARTYDFKYKDDNDFHNEFYKKKYNETYGNKQYDNQLEFSKDKASVEVIFSPSVLVGYEDESKIFSGIYKYEESTTTKTAQGHNIRIMQIKLIDGVPEWSMYDNAISVKEGILNYLYCGHFDDPNNPKIDINWGVTRELFYEIANTNLLGNNLFYIFYSPYMAEIINRDSKLLTCETYLSDLDIAKLDFRRLVMVDGVLFRLQKIMDWQTGELNKTELLRVINTTYPSTLGSTRYLKLTFTDITGLPIDADGWNTFFDLPTNGAKFSEIDIQGNDIYLYGSDQITIKADLFSSNLKITGVDDTAGCIILVGDGAFVNASNLRYINMPSCKIIGSNGFNTGSTSITYFNMPKLTTAGASALTRLNIKKIYLNKLKEIGESCFAQSNISEFEFPLLDTAGNSSFYQCFNMRKISIPSCKNLGSTTGDDNVFKSITTNTITAMFNKFLQTNNGGDPDGDIQYLDLNNTVTITYV